MKPATANAVRSPEPDHFRKYFISRKPFASSDKLEGSAVAAEPDGCGDKDGGECQPDPKAERGYIYCRRECDGIDRVPMEGKRFRDETHHAVLQQGGEV